jgi:hypothetical protein
MIEPNEKLSVKQQCRLLALSRSGYYYVPAKETDLNLTLLRRIDELNVEHPTWGSRMLRDRLALEGTKVNRKRIKRLMAILRVRDHLIPPPGISLILQGLLRYAETSEPSSGGCLALLGEGAFLAVRAA